MKAIYIALLFGILVGCSDDGGDTPPAPEVKVPTAAKLLFPENNSECFEGKIVSEIETEVDFQWEASENTSSYVMELKELESGSSRTINTVSNSQKIRIERGKAYSWSVTSKGSGTNQTAKSEVWKFYNVGAPQNSYPPFPAEAIEPKSGVAVDEGSVMLKWEATDIDGDISMYTVIMDNESEPTTEKGTTGATSFQVNVDSGRTYYWRIITHDKQGNTSNSQVFQFRVN